jgi:hypothetical protein
VDPPGQFHIAQATVTLQLVEQAKVDGVDFHAVNSFSKAFYAEKIPFLRYFSIKFRRRLLTVLAVKET